LKIILDAKDWLPFGKTFLVTNWAARGSLVIQDRDASKGKMFFSILQFIFHSFIIQTGKAYSRNADGKNHLNT
jgi:hypothetical protein